jgi:hypothetical protein
LRDLEQRRRALTYCPVIIRIGSMLIAVDVKADPNQFDRIIPPRVPDHPPMRSDSFETPVPVRLYLIVRAGCL